MREAHLDLATFPRGLLERFRSREAGDMLAHSFMRVDGQNAGGAGRALRLERASRAIVMTRSVDQDAVVGSFVGGINSVVKSFSGFDTGHAIMTGCHVPNAVEYCQRAIRAGGISQPIARCVAETLRMEPQHATANCIARTLTVRTSKSHWTARYRFPIEEMCGGDNMQAIALLKAMCPSVDDNRIKRAPQIE